MRSASRYGGPGLSRLAAAAERCSHDGGRSGDRARQLDHDVETGRERLNDLLGRDLDTPFNVEPVPAATAEEADLTPAREKARERRPKSRFAEQAALLEDVLEAEQAHAQAAADRQQALLGYWTARADFAQALGEEP